MLAKTYSDVRNNLKSVCDTITNNDEIVIVTRKNDNNIVMMSIDQYNNIIENMYVRSSRKNYERLLESVEELEAGKTIAKDDEELKRLGGLYVLAADRQENGEENQQHY